MTTPTANYGWTKPDVGASNDAWGGLINADLDGIDSTVKSVSTVANAALPTATASSTYLTIANASATYLPTATASATYVAKAGDTMTGNLTITPSAAGYGIVTVNGTGTNNGSAIILNQAAGTGGNAIQGRVAASVRWIEQLGDGTAEGSGNTGSNYTLARCDNTGAFINAPFQIARSSGQATFSVAIVNGSSDRRLKQNIAPLEGSLDKVLALQGVSFNMVETPDKPEIGLIAQDVQPIIPEIVQSYTFTSPESGETSQDFLSLDYPKLTAHLIEAIKTLAARVEALEAAANG